MEKSVDLEHFTNLTSTLIEHYFYFSTILFFYNSNSERSSRDVFNILINAFKMPVIVFNEEAAIINLKKTIDLDTIAVAILENPEDKLKVITQETLTRMHSIKMIFKINAPSDPNPDVLQKFFEWCWKYNLLSVLAIFGNKSYSYDPFPNIKIYNVAHYPSKALFRNHTNNLEGYNFSTPIRFDPPRVFFGPSKKLSGSAGIWYKNFVRKVNGTLTEVQVPNATYNLHQKDIIKLSLLKISDVSIHPTSDLLPYDSEKSYPMFYTNSCLIVPVNSEIDKMLYILYPFHAKLWILIVVVIVAFLIGYVIIYRFNFNDFHRKRRHIMALFEDVLKGLLYIPLSATDIRVNLWRNWRLIILNALLIFAGFIFSNMYTATFTSLLSTTVYGKQLETVGDFIRMKQRIMMLDYECDVFINTTGPYPKEFTSLIMKTDADTVAKHRDVLNTTYAYLVSKERWKVLNKQQDKLWKPYFRMASNKLCLTDFFLGFPIQKDSPFYEQLKSFGGTALQSGLVDKWEDISYIDAVNVGLITKFKESRVHPTPLGMEYFTLVWFELVIGWTLSAVVLCVECFLTKMKRKST